MSGQLNKKPSDMVKTRQEYLDNLSLQVQLNDANLAIVTQFKSTGQVPPISQMKDMRTPTQILEDVEKLKINLIKDLEPIADPQFAQQIVSRLIQSPLNIDNRLLVFTAQRIDEIVKNLQRIYKYGIRGDENDAETFVQFMNKFYTDKNKSTLGVKDFMNRMGGSDATSASSNIAGQHNNLVSILASYESLIVQIFKRIAPVININTLNKLRFKSRQIQSILEGLIQIMPVDSGIFAQIERILVIEAGTAVYDEYNNNFERWLYFLNNNIPNLDYVQTLLYDINNIVSRNKVALNQISINKIENILEKLNGVLDVDMNELNQLKIVSEELLKLAYEQEYRPDILQGNQPTQGLLDEYEALRQKVNDNLGLMDDAGLDTTDYDAENDIYNIDDQPQNLQRLESLRLRTFNALAEYEIIGQGFNKISAPQFQNKIPIKKISGRGLTSMDESRGIQPSPRYIKFGRYMINNKKLNDNVLSLRRSKGSSISTIPATKMTSTLGGIIKCIVGGGTPSYDELNKLTEAEKKYLYKVSQEADIYDKIKIPTPGKDAEEKDVHAFNVMKGEILAGNNSKELITKFKALINRLSKTNVLPRSQVSEILNELLELGF